MSEEKTVLKGKELRYAVIEFIETGKATMSTILDEFKSSLKDKRALARVFGELRIMEKYPVAGEDGIYSFMTEEEYEAHQKAEKMASKKKPKLKTGMQKKRRNAIIRRTDKLNTYNLAADKARKSTDTIDGMKAQIAQLNFSIADIQLKRLKAQFVEQLGLNSESELDEIRDLDEYVTSVNEANEATG